jgi:hypothetical protein
MESSVYLGFMDGASRHMWKMASTTWVIYSPEGQLVSSGGVHLEPSMNNVVEYSHRYRAITRFHFTWCSVFRGSLRLLVSHMSVERQLPCARSYSTLTIPTGTTFGMIL